MELWEAILFGVLQGIGEFLPISSSAHLIVASHLTNGRAMPLTLNVALHVGTAFAVLIYFWSDWQKMIVGLLRGFRTDKSTTQVDRTFWFLVVGTLPAAVLGLGFKDLIETYLHQPLVLVAPLAIVGVLLYWIDRAAVHQKDLSSLSFPKAITIGFLQALALIPGVSRSGATIIGGRLLGLSRDHAARFSFLLGTPIMVAAAVLELKHIEEAVRDPMFSVAVIASFLTGCITIKFLLSFIRSYGFGLFAIYRIIFAGVVLYLFWPQTL